MKKKKLLHRIFIIPSLIVLVSLLSVFILFQLISEQYIKNLTNDALKLEMNNLGTYTYELSESSEESEDSSALIVPVMHLVLDSKNKLRFPTSPWYDAKEVKTATQITEIISADRDAYKDSPHRLEADGSFYLVQAKDYLGTIENDIFVPVNNKNKQKEYYILFYINITPIQNFINSVNLVLIAALVLSGTGSVLFLFLTTRKANKDFENLKSYLISIGEHEKKRTDRPASNYSEIEAVITTVNKMSEMLSENEKVQKRFFQNASHELRTPLMSIQGYAEGIKYKVLPVDEATDIILKESEKMASLINEILFLSKMETAEPMFEEVNVAELLNEAADNFKMIAKENNIDIIRNIKTEPLVSCDTKLLDRLLNNLISNGVRYAKSKLILSCEIFDNAAIIKVADDGTGIAAEDLPHIFERFYKGKGGKFGIGLSMASDIAKLHNGRLEAESGREGTVFTLRLPQISHTFS